MIATNPILRAMFRCLRQARATGNPAWKTAAGRLSDAYMRAAAAGDNSALTSQLTGYEGMRVSVVRHDGTVARFIVGRSTGLIVRHVEYARSDSRTGREADRSYRHVTPLHRVLYPRH